MAIDEALLEHCTCPALRFYGWRGPSLSFGYFGKFADIARETKDRELVRRWTGGGSVPHGEDLTYSLVTPASDPASGRGPPLIYAALHSAIRQALSGGWAGDRTGHGSRRRKSPTLVSPIPCATISSSAAAKSPARPSAERAAAFSIKAAFSCPICPKPFATDSRPLLQRRSSMKKSRRKSSNAPPSWPSKNTELKPGCVVGRMPSSSFDFKSRPSILRL